MDEDSRGFVLDISEHLLRLTKESLRLRSLETQCDQTLGSLVDARAAETKTMESHDPATIRDHLAAVPTDGKVRLDLTISRSSADTLHEVKERLASQLGSSLTLGDTLSILLFDYVVEQKVAGVMHKLALDETNENRGEPIASDSQDGNVIRLR